jgi:predicted acylesterase/phospholipase RssA
MALYLLGALTLALCAFVGAIIYGFIVPLRVHFRTELPRLKPPEQVPHQNDKPFVGLALSGGGSRAAVFAAAGMKALHARGVLEHVSHVSSVSGGGFAAAYWALYPMQFAISSKSYFAQMQSVMAHDFFWHVQMRQLVKPSRAFSPSRRLVSLQNALDQPDFLNGACFADLPKDRQFFFNAVSYDTGQRFTFSNSTLPAPDMPESAVLPAALRSLSFSDANGIRETPAAVPISLAVATSAAFPPYLGPATIQIDESDGTAKEYWHLGDGGIVENSGIETLREAVYARGENQRAVIYVFNAGQRLDSVLSKKSHDISIWSREVTRLVDVLLEYATAHRVTMFDALDRKHGMQIDVIEFDYLDVARLARAETPPNERWLSWDGWYYATHADRMASKTPADHLAKIPTALRITPSHQELIAAAADYLVNHRLSAPNGKQRVGLTDVQIGHTA